MAANSLVRNKLYSNARYVVLRKNGAPSPNPHPTASCIASSESPLSRISTFSGISGPAPILHSSAVATPHWATADQDAPYLHRGIGG